MKIIRQITTGLYHLEKITIRQLETGRSVLYVLGDMLKELASRPKYFFIRSIKILSAGGMRSLVKAADEKCRFQFVRVALGKQSLRQQGPIDYETWIALFDTLTHRDRNAIHLSIDRLAYRPLISIIMPVDNSPERFLRWAIASVRNQLYPKWELCLTGDASTEQPIRTLLESYREQDSRIKVVFREIKGNTSTALNSALEMASGEFIAPLNPEDELAEHALYWVAIELNEHPEADILYSDEDKIDEGGGRRFDPHFKSDWNPDLYYSQNYVSHFTVYRSSRVSDVGGFREGFEGSQDYDLGIRCVARTVAERIRHIPRILYHGRTVEGAAASDPGVQSYSGQAAIRALTDYFKTVNPAVEIEVGSWPGLYRRFYPLPSEPPLVSLIIPTRNGYPLLQRCIESIKTKTTYPNYEIIVVDNQSDDPETLKYFDQFNGATVKILKYDRDFNFSAINNFAVRHAQGRLLGLINSDIEVITPTWLTEMVSHALRPEIGAVGAMLYYGNGLIQHAGIIIGICGFAGHSHKGGKPPGYFGRLLAVQNLSAVTAACLVTRKEVYERVGGFDEKLAVALNDVEFCVRLRSAGYRNLWTPFAELYHHESLSRGYEDTPEKQLRFRDEIEYVKRRWGDLVLKDPYYSPNLTIDREDFSLACPPRVKAIGQ